MNAVLLSTDLMAVSRVQGAATPAGGRVRAVGSAAAAIECCGAAPVDVVVVDLATAGLNMQDLVAQVKAASAASRVIAFGPHVHEDRLAAARAAGCDSVLSRGQFFAQAENVLAGR